jgi:hypothetical protein
VRSRLSALTGRGRAFLSAGVSALACAVLFGLGDLTRVGVLLLSLPLVSLLVVTGSRHQLGLARSVSPAQVPVGQPARVDLALANEGWAPTGLLLLEDQVPPSLGVRPRFVVDRMGARWHRDVSYTVRSDARGRYVLGPMRVRVTDPFGLVELDRTFRTATTLVVVPEVVPLTPIPLTGTWTGSGDNRPRDFAGGSAEDVTVREYRRGDDLRRVHWRSSAHAGELMVRREEQPWQSRATVFVDNRQHAHRGAGPASTLEYAVTAAASIAMHLARRGFRVRLITADGGDTGGGSEQGWHEHGAAASESGPLLESLAVLVSTPRVDIDAGWLTEAQRTGLLVAVLGRTVATDGPVLARMRHAAGTALALTVDEQSAPLLAATGWRAATALPGDPLASVWQELGRTAGRGSGRAADPAGVAR